MDSGNLLVPFVFWSLTRYRPIEGEIEQDKSPQIIHPFSSPPNHGSSVSEKERKSREGGMDVRQLQRQWIDLISALFREGFLDAQFTQLQQLQDESNPDFVVEVVTLFFEDSERVLNDLCNVLSQQVVDFNRVDAHVHQLKGSSASIGAQRVKNVCISFRNCCEERNLEG
ncbi:Histidine-containing phosphotransfer protein 1 [Dendrobium catenatum]|uniref:Histidine-containing phosphotransfer protein n=2 Tax=Dendrobium catenatum TaxID=906689 RepID=A0A2I0WY19_9ASPA|nr:Histidine-containing phosphotransfer protein 1 [Dendrobium catenatum]